LDFIDEIWFVLEQNVQQLCGTTVEIAVEVAVTVVEKHGWGQRRLCRLSQTLLASVPCCSMQ
jgi:hypothetical protein